MKSPVELSYFMFLLAVFVVYWSISRRQQNIFLLLASYFFYACLGWRFLGLLLLVTVINYILGFKIYSSQSAQTRKLLLVFAIILNLGLLGYFKYANSFINNFAASANLFGWKLSGGTLSVTLPLGVSFYIFMALTYPLDIYRNKMQPAKSFLGFANFVAFFPKLVAGPIVRATDFVHQTENTRTFNWSEVEEGCIRILTGYFKKAFIADTLALHLVNPVFNNPGSYQTGMLWLAMFGYSVQIYADFSGYSNMAIGAAKILGFKVPENFLFPYLATSFSDFWRRWHITMSTFFRDYLFIPLGGSRCKRGRICINLIVTMCACGLWHGPAWTFVVWGALHGIYLMAGHLVPERSVNGTGKIADPSSISIFFKWVLTTFMVTLAWVPFRAADLKTAMVYFAGLTGSEGVKQISLTPLLWCGFIAFLLDHTYGWIRENRAQLTERTPKLAFVLLYTVLIVFVFHALPEQSNPFIYFQF